MKEVLPIIADWQAQDEQIALATVVRITGSAPRPEGAKMLISASGKMAGSVSGGCVEGAVFEEAQKVLKKQRPRLLHFGIADEQAWGVGLACGGVIDVFVEPLDLPENLASYLAADRPAALVTVIQPPEVAGRKLFVSEDGRSQGSLGYPQLDERVVREALVSLHTETSQVFSYPIDAHSGGLFETSRGWRAGVPNLLGGDPGHPQQVGDSDEVTTEIPGEPFGGDISTAPTVEFFIDVYPASPKLIVVGAVHIAIPLVKFARELGFRTTVVDARSVFATPERFAHADDLIIAWPDEALAKLHIDNSTYVVVLTHDEKLDDPALKVALASPARYIGALGSQTTHDRRMARLKAEGITDQQLARLHAPIGLEIGARTPEEMAISILGEIVAARYGVNRDVNP